MSPSSLLSMLGGSGAAGGRPGGADPDSSPLEALLSSPLLQGGLGGKGNAKMLGTIRTVLAIRRRAKRMWRALKPYLPLLFWMCLLLPPLLAYKQQLLAYAPWKWVPPIELPSWIPGWVRSSWGVALGAAAAPAVVGSPSAADGVDPRAVQETPVIE